MKIVAKLSNGYLAEVNEEEIANLTGWASVYENGFKRRDYRDGDVIQITKMFQRLNNIKGSSYQIAEIRRHAQALLQMVDSVEPVLCRHIETMATEPPEKVGEQ